MAAEAEAAREARAKIIRSSGEEKAIRTLRQAADELVSPRALQLRYLQVCIEDGGTSSIDLLLGRNHRRRHNNMV